MPSLASSYHWGNGRSAKGVSGAVVSEAELMVAAYEGGSDHFRLGVGATLGEWMRTNIDGWRQRAKPTGGIAVHERCCAN